MKYDRYLAAWKEAFSPKPFQTWFNTKEVETHTMQAFFLGIEVGTILTFEQMESFDFNFKLGVQNDWKKIKQDTIHQAKNLSVQAMQPKVDRKKHADR